MLVNEKENFGLKDVPNVRISVMENDEIVYSLVLDAVQSFDKDFNTIAGYTITIETALINPTDYAALVSKKYDKYIIETENIWQNINEIEDTVIEDPAALCTNFEIHYVTNYNGEAAIFQLEFWGKVS